MSYGFNIKAAEAVTKGMAPSEYMRLARPELFSDSGKYAAFRIDRSVLDHHLDSLTSRNQTQAFELFCRDLCGRLICPNLKPATGPEGGGDSKADTETISVAEEIQTLHYIGEPRAGQERWAFAFSAKKDWKAKVRHDVDGLVGTGRPYTKVIFVTSCYAPAKQRAAIEDDLEAKHGVRVEIHDRTWILKAVVDDGHADLAIDRLGVGERIADPRFGPEDYRRLQTLDALERALTDPTAYAQRETERVNDALSAALLSRELEKPRFETEGRFDRAIRLADRFGTPRQRVETRYERLWATYYWFDDFDRLSEDFDDVATRAYATDDAELHELVANLVQNLANAVMLGHRSAEEMKLKERRDDLMSRLDSLWADPHRPNNALEARTTWLFAESTRIMMARDDEAFANLWPLFSEVISKADGLSEYRVQRLEPIVDIFGRKAGRHAAYRQLVDDLAAFVAKRAGDARGGLIRLKRAMQLDIEEDRMEIIRLLGQATRELAQREHIESQVEATYTLAVAYRGAGLLWAARAAAMFSVATVFAEAERDSEPPASIVPALMLLGWIDAELRLLPELLDVIRLVRGCLATLPLDEESKERVGRRLTEFDGVLASSLLNTTVDERSALGALPDILNALDMNASNVALLYGLGHQAVFDTEEALPDQSWEKALARWADQLPRDIRSRPLLLNAEAPQTQLTRVVGMTVRVATSGSAVSIVTGQTLLTVIEAVFATTLESGIAAHTESFSIEVVEAPGSTTPSFTIDEMTLSATLSWPLGVAPNSPGLAEVAYETLFGLTLRVVLTTCVVRDPVQVFDGLFANGALGERISAALTSLNSRSRAFNSPLSRIEAWRAMGGADYPLQPDAPAVIGSHPTEHSYDQEGPAAAHDHWKRDHRRIEVRSVIDLPVWERAGWLGLALGVCPPGAPPILGFHFTQPEWGQRIFSRWRERFGEEDEESAIRLSIIRHLPGHPASHYGAMISPGISTREASSNLLMVSTRLKILEPPTDENLRRFLEAYDREKAYLLVPAGVSPDGSPMLQHDLAILKRDLVVTSYDDIADDDVESLARTLIRSRHVE